MGKRRNRGPQTPVTLELPVLRVEPPVRLDGRPEALALPADGLPLPGMLLAMEGPIPSPGTLHEYNRMMPGLAERIVDWAEQEARHRRTVERSLVRMSWGGMWCALLVSLTTIGGGMVLAWQGRSTVGLVGVVGAVAGLVIVFVAGRRQLPPDTAGDYTPPPHREPREAAA